MAKIKTSSICRYGRTEYAANKEFDVPDGVAADMLLNKHAKLIKGSTRDLLKEYKPDSVQDKFREKNEPKPAKPIKVKRKR